MPKKKINLVSVAWVLSFFSIISVATNGAKGEAADADARREIVSISFEVYQFDRTFWTEV